MPVDSDYINPEQLCVGLYVHLDLGWMDHPFVFSSFKIKTQEQIDTIRKLKLTRIRYEQGKSVCKPLPVKSAPASVSRQKPSVAVADIALMEAKKVRIAQLKHIKNEISRVEHEFVRAADTVRNITRNIHSRPQEAFAQTEALVGKMVKSIQNEGDVLIHAMSGKLGDDVYFHSLNVTVLSLMLANVLGLSGEQMHELGMGAMLHDVGKSEVPHKILSKPEPLTKPEQAILEQHCDFGAVFAKKIGLSNAALAIIIQHHEFMDGSGYPRKLSGGNISPLARIVSIVNTYDNLCNPVNPANGLTPAEALSRMFALRRAQFDDGMLKAFIHCLGVYPPGSIVQLSNAMFGLVLSVNSVSPLKPNVLIYDESIPKDEAIVACLATEPDLKINKSLRASELTREARQYLNPRARVTFYFDPQKNTNSA
ncbi:HD-GYP domain-containing protein [Sulfuriferula sp. AH1]|uniref:HD-GYP domain-containing protein n=1 Tax=Sulfuriferula sp. AH1 TaxID=1985873 RepID=UPI0016752863|nr:HD-GYP domain-containing protein [Sulfuriferula sp. AH1]